MNKKQLMAAQVHLINLCQELGWTLECDNQGQIVFYTGLMVNSNHNDCEDHSITEFVPDLNK